MFSSANLEETQEKTSIFGLSRLGSSSIRKSSSHSQRPSTPRSPTKISPDFGGDRMRPVKERESAVLRKRPLSTMIGSDNVTAAPMQTATRDTDINGAVLSGLVKPGQSILDQIGEADHVGWMRKRGDRYNSWKNRYFVFKGPHMYCLKSDSKAVSQPLHWCLVPVFYSHHVRRKQRSRGTSISSDIRFLWTRPLILDDMDSGLITIMIKRIISVLMRRQL